MRAYAAKCTAGGKSKKDILRCLKRTITDVANAFGCGIAKISRIERGHISRYPIPP